ncbi:hypothetical protein [Terrilactibacillus tamarindi]|nr:hypothetical protein [Terrilactibacillus tamarindi]
MPQLIVGEAQSRSEVEQLIVRRLNPMPKCLLIMKKLNPEVKRRN